MKKKIKLNIVKLEKYIIIQFNEMPEIISLGKYEDGDLFWNFRISNTKSKTHLKLRRYGDTRNFHIYLNLNDDEIFPNRVHEVKFHDNSERDSFYEGFLNFLNNIK